MAQKSSAHYQREFRQRMRERGLVKKDVWIRPEWSHVLSKVETHLRGEGKDVGWLDQVLSEQEGTKMSGAVEGRWSIGQLAKALEESELVVDGHATVEVIQGAEATILIEMIEFGQLPLFVSVQGMQILVDAVLWSVDEVNDVAGFNKEVLRTHKLFPLSNISLDRYPDGKDYYTMFGALSAQSHMRQIITEIELLAENVMNATSAYGSYLSGHEAAS